MSHKTAARRIKAVIRFEYFSILVYCLFSEKKTTLELCKVIHPSIFSTIFNIYGMILQREITSIKTIGWEVLLKLIASISE